MKQTPDTRIIKIDTERCLWATSDVAKFLRCSERQIYSLRQQGLPSIQVGGMVRFDPAKVRAWLSEKDDYVPSCERSCQLTDIANENDSDNAECAAADLFREFPPTP